MMQSNKEKRNWTTTYIDTYYCNGIVLLYGYKLISVIVLKYVYSILVGKGFCLSDTAWGEGGLW